ncbi:MAG: TetR/AcrR family transcriptional regulator [Actinobacteria bacterium]|nr:TetR/AcrR family transcriptional regulator [Actinomycetota bacterium]
MGEETTTTRKARAPRRREQEILEAAAEVFHEHGYESTSIKDIAEKVGILKGSLYYYISSKEDLLYEIIKGVHEEALRNLEKTRAVDGNALKKLRAFAVIHFRFNAENRVKTAVFFQDFRSLSEERRATIVDERDIYDNFVRDLIREGQEQGLICPDIDAKVAAISILGMLNWIYHWYRPGGEQSAAELAEAYGDFVVAGLACRPDDHVPGHRRALAPLPQGFDPFNGNGRD